MPLRFSLAAEDEMSLIVPFQFAAFHPVNTIHRLIYPSPVPVPDSVIKSTIQRQLKTWREDPRVTWVVVRDPDVKIRDVFGDGQEKQRIVAAAKWVVWPPTEGEDAKKRWPDKINVDWIAPSLDPANPNYGPNGAADDQAYVSWVMEQFFQRRRERIQGPAVLLDACFTDPEYHRRGAGKMLVQWGAAKADELGVRAFVEASPEGKRLYESCGFEVKEEIVLAGDEAPHGKSEWRDYGYVDWFFMERPKKN
ncbi:hypothetical protein EG329_007545 [Mollisiaceae sp. DMI_Dod_QoI]|nr:hypothetical protein EG329_007545 [Helotiales sp. DMI_Dod_QoI]